MLLFAVAVLTPVSARLLAAWRQARAGASGAMDMPGPAQAAGLRWVGGGPFATPLPPELAAGAPGVLSVYFLDGCDRAGDGGAATLVQGPEFALLIDAGTRPTSAGAAGSLLEQLLALGVEHLDMAIVTNEDRAGQMLGIIPLLAPDILWVPADRPANAAQQALHDAAREVGDGPYAPRAGEVYRYEDLQVEVLYPPDGTGLGVDGSAAAVHGALALRLTYGDVRLLFAGDTLAEGALLASGVDLRADVLRLAPGGPDPFAAGDYMQAVAPALAIYTPPAGEAGLFALRELQGAGVPLYSTCDHGNLRFATDGHRYQIEALPAR